MLPTEKQKQRAAQLQRERQAWAANVVKPAQGAVNPLYMADPFEPSSYLPQVPADPSLAQPLPSGRFVDPRIPSGAAVARAADIEQFRLNPNKYVQENITDLNVEQSLIDKGASMLARIFNYNDEADLQAFGVNLSAAESAWDGFLRYFTGAYDLLSIGFGGLISAAPGGVRTLSYDELSGGKSVGEVLSGEMVPGSAPSPGQIAVASIAAEAKRIREGGARLSDVLLMNPATAPFILAALAADTSPLQQDGFNIMDQQQREQAFSSGFEQWMSGITDAGLMFADPLIGVGVAGKVMRAGLLGKPGSAKAAQAMKAATDNALQEMGTGGIDQLEQIIEIGTTKQDDLSKGIVREIIENPTYEPAALVEPVTFSAADAAPTYQNPLANFLRRLHTVDENGNKIMTADEIARDPNFKGLADKASVADVLHKSQSPAQSALIIQAMSGTAGALERLQRFDAGLADVVFRYRRNAYAAKGIFTEPAKHKEVVDGLNRQIDNTRQELTLIDEQLRKIPETGLTPDDQARATALRQKKLVHEQNLAEAQELVQVANGKQIDFLDPTNPFYRADRAEAIERSLLNSQDANMRFFRSELQSIARESETFLPTTNNWYSRRVMASRQRRQTAAFQYAAEGTNWLPRKVLQANINGKMQYDWQWWSGSQFEGTSALQRNMRIWRWLGQETPNGWIGLKGGATVGSEREFIAATNTELYKGDAIKVKRVVLDAEGKPVQEFYKDANGTLQSRVVEEEIEVGGIAKRQEYYRRFYEALNNPTEDAKTVLDEIEQQMMDDYAAAYGLDNTMMQEQLKVANKHRAATMETMRTRGYFVDPDTGELHFIPYLDPHLANGTYMQNFHELEKILKAHYSKDGMKSLKASLETPAHLAGGAYSTFNTFWRPATLLRLSYTQRNIFEGTLRAMAYSASLAPLSWPVRATAYGVRNQVMMRAVTRRIKEAGSRVADSAYGKLVASHNEASVNEYFLKTAIYGVHEGMTEPAWAVVNKDRSIRYLTDAQYKRELENVSQDVTDTFLAMKQNVKEFDDAVANTAFGKWRQKNIRDLEQQLKEQERRAEILTENHQNLLDDGLEAIFDEGVLGQFAEVNAALQKIQRDLNDLRFTPDRATQMYRDQAGRQRRIGSGKSMGPDGNKYDDAWTGPYDQINRNLMSADNTVTQALSLNADSFSNPFLRIATKPNTAVPFTPETRKQWSKGMAEAIEEASSSWLVRTLIDNNWDIDKAFGVMIGTNEGQTFMQRVLPLMGEGSLEDVAKTLTDKSVLEKGAPSFAEASRTAGGVKQVSLTNKELAYRYVAEVADNVMRQMQRREEFMDLLTRRASSKKAGAKGTGVSVSAQTVEDVLNGLPQEALDSLGFIQGATIIRMGTDGVLGAWTKLASSMFKYLGTIPEDAITRGGFYNMRFKTMRNALIEDYLVQSGQGAALKKGRRARSASGADQGATIAHGEFSIPQNELSRIYRQAHRKALADTREWMYTIERRTNLGKYGEWIFPFISATQNSATVGAKLLYKEPWLAPMIIDLWRMPSRLGIEDEEGNIRLPMPLDWVRNTLKDHPEIPVIGGVLDSVDQIKIPKNGLNVFMPETGFGFAPQPTPWVQVAASELMKANALPVETPSPIKAILGDEAGNEFYKSFKDWMFGEDIGQSAEFGSWDKLFPAAAAKFIYSRNELSAQWGYQHSLQWHTQTMRFRSGERDTPPTEAEINQRTTNSFWFALFGNLGVPTPLTPYPILTRPQVDSPVTALQDVYKKLQEADPLTANLNMDRLFGDWGLEAAMTKVSQNVGGADPTPATVSDIETLSPLIREISPDLGPQNLNVLGILINNRRPAESYEQSAYNWEKTATIPGTNRQWREVQSPEQAVAERQRIVGWTVYRRAMDQLDAQLKSAGFTSYEVKGAAAFKQAKKVLVENMKSNPDYAGWLVDYQDQGGSKTLSAVRVMEAAVKDKSFQNLLISNNKERLFGIMNEYVNFRRDLIQVLQNTGHSIDHDSNVMWKIAWDSMRLKWRSQDERWAEIDSLYLSGDDNPVSPGNLAIQNIAAEEVLGVAQ